MAKAERKDAGVCLTGFCALCFLRRCMKIAMFTARSNRGHTNSMNIPWTRPRASGAAGLLANRRAKKVQVQYAKIAGNKHKKKSSFYFCSHELSFINTNFTKT